MSRSKPYSAVPVQHKQTQQIGELHQAVFKALQQHQLERRTLLPCDSVSLRSDGEREMVRRLVERYRALPEEQRRQLPALLNGLGKPGLTGLALGVRAGSLRLQRE